MAMISSRSELHFLDNWQAQPELESRLLNALVRLRYTCPILSATPVQNIHDHELRSWVYTPIQKLQQAKEWASAVLRSNTSVAQSNPEAELCDLVERLLDNQQVFEVHLVGPYVNGEHTLFVYASHAFLEGQSMIALIRQLLSWMVYKDLRVEDGLQSEEAQVQNLEPNAILALGGLPRGWDEESPAFFKELETAASIEKPSHALKPQRTTILEIGKIVRAHRSLDQETTSRLLKATKANGLTVTQVLEAAHVVASYALEPLSPSEMAESHVSLFPALVSTRHLRVPPYDKPEAFGNLNTGFTLVFPSDLVNFPPNTSLCTRVLTLARSSQAQYRAFLSNPCHPFVPLVQAEVNPMRRPSDVHLNQYAGEITSLGVVDGKIGRVWHDEECPGERPAILVKDVHLGLRQCTKRTTKSMVHSWTLQGQLRIQIQASDIWDAWYLERFLDEIINGALSICGSES
ncbi:hypothetical protein FRC10_009833 [Ceratobasidium sp. 414]|nr:hypothetical protein FRC10_009833 [Ceratobasidium sp. 414]